MSSTKALLTKVKEEVCKIHGLSYGWTWWAEGLRAGRENCGELGRSWQYIMWAIEGMLNPLCLKSIRGPVWSIPERVNKSGLCSSCSLWLDHFLFFILTSFFPGQLSFILWVLCSNSPPQQSLPPALQARAGGLCTFSLYPALCQCSTRQRHIEIMTRVAFGKWPHSLVIGHFANYLVIDLIVIFRQQYYTTKMMYAVIIKLIKWPSLEFKLFGGRDCLGPYAIGSPVPYTVSDT